MSEHTNPSLNPDTQSMLDCRRQSFSETLERKPRFGQYSVQWAGKTPFAVGDDVRESLYTS